MTPATVAMSGVPRSSNPTSVQLFIRYDRDTLTGRFVFAEETLIMPRSWAPSWWRTPREC